MQVQLSRPETLLKFYLQQVEVKITDLTYTVGYLILVCLKSYSKKANTVHLR